MVSNRCLLEKENCVVLRRRTYHCDGCRDQELSLMSIDAEVSSRSSRKWRLCGRPKIPEGFESPTSLWRLIGRKLRVVRTEGHMWLEVESPATTPSYLISARIDFINFRVTDVRLMKQPIP